MLRKVFITAIKGCAVFTALSQQPAAEEKKSVTRFSGFVDAYYRYDLKNSPANNFTSFTGGHNAFELGMFSLKAEHSIGKVNMVADLGLGQRAKEFSYNDEGITSSIKQLFISYTPQDWLKFTIGSWATHVGYELVDAPSNRNYSMSYMFTNGPFFHTGIKTEFTAGKHSLMIGVANPTDYKIPPSDMMNKKFLIAQYGLIASEKVKGFLNYVRGQFPDTAKMNQLDAVITAQLSNRFSIGWNSTFCRIKTWDGQKNLEGKNWWGSALYLNYDPKEWFALTLRSEYFNDKNQLKLNSPGDSGCTIWANTLSANFKVNSLIIIPEFRIERCNKKLYSTKNGTSVQTASQVLLAAVYSF
ncbi:MAG: porin [Chitinophagaceae bacterium]|nr:porin [Chitinophagaceae bacterium]